MRGLCVARYVVAVVWRVVWDRNHATSIRDSTHIYVSYSLTYPTLSLSLSHFHVHYHPRSFFLVPRCRAQVQVNALVLEHVFATQGQVGTQVGGHFKQQLMAKAVKLLGGVEVLGNPAGLVRSLGTFMEKRDEER